MAERIIHLNPRAKDITGQRFGRLVAEYPVRVSSSRIYWHCTCDCGNTKTVRGTHMWHGRITSCGCKRGGDHGMTGTRVYRIWGRMINRCEDATSINYARYGGIGIRVCNEWRNSFESFYSDMGECPSPKHSIDRINNDGDYCKENCRWATPTEQGRNKRNNHMITYRGETRCLSEWADILDINQGTLHSRIVRQRWPVDRAFTEKVHS